MDDRETEQKIEELMEKWESDQLLFSECIKEAILFGQSHMKQRVKDSIPKAKEIEMCENHCDSCLKNEGFNDCRNQVLDVVEKL